MVRQKPADDAVRAARGRNLARERAKSGLTLEALGRKLGVSAEQVRKYQTGRDFLGPSACWRFSKALGCRFGLLFEIDQALDGVAETPAAFRYDEGDEAMLADVLALAQARLTGARRADLRDILLDVLEREERGAP